MSSVLGEQDLAELDRIKSYYRDKGATQVIKLAVAQRDVVRLLALIQALDDALQSRERELETLRRSMQGCAREGILWSGIHHG